MHQRSKTNMLSKRKFFGKVLSNTITGREQFSLECLCKYELKHITITLTKDDFILPKFRKTKSRGLIFDFFSFKIEDSLLPKEIKEIVEPGTDKSAIGKKKLDNKEKVSISFLPKEEIEIKKTILTRSNKQIDLF